ncbi:AraC family transcriptional regulator [Paenibacillus selenitireducens]|uniref:AraC family transcriptional regulator n=1 Tax=Paenibacillus selenitireducens TaxID=1324314 RepID=A0A1T2X0Y5_9BACL|nr:AraC family transcriptional regulator [Paenibacillus selenitireducens]OPA73376.1 AraC family transcriptional regulator [Paenibacillus selenitireducens]
MTPPLFIPLEDLQFTYAGSVVYPPGGRFGPRIQQDLQLVLLYTGEMNVSIDGRELNVKPGHVVLLKPGHEETFTFSKTEETWHRWISIRVSPLADKNRDDLYQLPECLTLSEEMNRLTDLILNLQPYCTGSDPVIRSLGLAALHLFPIESNRMNRQQEKHPAVHKAMMWIRDHYGQETNLSNLSLHAGVSPEHLLRLFKLHEGTTPIHYLWSYRIERAIELLTHTGLTISEIATRCGFKTSHHFARMIKQITGQPATEIRQQSWSRLRHK